MSLSEVGLLVDVSTVVQTRLVCWVVLGNVVCYLVT